MFRIAGALPAVLLGMADASACTVGSNGITAGSSLSFGGIIASNGTITIAPNGTRTVSGAVPLTISSAPVPGAASFAVCSATNTTATITLPGNSEIFLSDGNGHSMAVSGFTSSATGGGLSVNSASSTSLSVGATLTVASNQAPGNYSGSFQVTVTYQ